MVYSGVVILYSRSSSLSQVIASSKSPLVCTISSLNIPKSLSKIDSSGGVYFLKMNLLYTEEFCAKIGLSGERVAIGGLATYYDLSFKSPITLCVILSQPFHSLSPRFYFALRKCKSLLQVVRCLMLLNL